MKASIVNEPIRAKLVKGISNLTAGIWKVGNAYPRYLIVPDKSPTFDAKSGLWNDCFLLNTEEMQFSGNSRGELWDEQVFEWLSPSASIVLKND